MVTKLLSLHYGVDLAESYWKESNISDTNWSRYLFSSYLIKIWLSLWCHHLEQKEEQKEIFENSKQQFTSLPDYLFMLKWIWLERCDFHHSTTFNQNNIIAFSTGNLWIRSVLHFCGIKINYFRYLFNWLKHYKFSIDNFSDQREQEFKSFNEVCFF